MSDNNDAELTKMLLKKLKRGEQLGFSWKPKLEWLYKNGHVNNEQLQFYINFHQESRDAGNLILAEKQAKLVADYSPIPCTVCGDVINAGTYGFIFNSKNSPFNVIKGSIKGHSITTGCPPDFEHEIIMYQKIYPIFQRIKSSNLVGLLDIKNKFIENRRCYYEMDKVFPYVINESLKQKIQIGLTNPTYLKDITGGFYNSSNNNDSYFLENFLKMDTLIMLTPGINNDYISTGGNKNSSWLELGENKLKMLFFLLDINYDDYCMSLILLLQSTLNNNIILNDVEFILGSVNTGDGFRNGIFMIDFDKVVEKTTPVTPFDIKNLLDQDMFPEVVRSSFRIYYQKKYLKYKKKYENLKNKINLIK